MPKPTRVVHLTGLSVLASVLVACSAASPSAAPSSTPNSSSSSAGPSSAPCAAGSLATKTPGVLTVGTDNPAFPPYFAEPANGETLTAPWENGDPTNGRGFESAVAYAVAADLGFTSAAVTWIPVTFDNSFAPGEKDFDIYLGQVSFTQERTQGADLSDGYFFGNQALVADAETPIASATTVSQVAGYRLGVATNTTSLTYIQERIHPTTEPSVFNDNNGAIAALNGGQVDGIVVDVPTAFFIANVEMDNGVVVGQFPSNEGEQEHFSFVLELDSPLTDCVNDALAHVAGSGELEAITDEWMADMVNAAQITE